MFDLILSFFIDTICNEQKNKTEQEDDSTQDESVIYWNKTYGDEEKQ